MGKRLSPLSSSVPDDLGQNVMLFHVFCCCLVVPYGIERVRGKVTAYFKINGESLGGRGKGSSHEISYSGAGVSSE